MYKNTSRMAIAAAVLALSFGTAQAQTAASGAQGSPSAHHWHRGGGPFAVFKQLHDSLKLDTQQEQQYQAAVTLSKQNRQAMRHNFEQARSQFEAAQNQPILDLDALHNQRQRVEQQNTLLREQTERTWLTFYDGLNDQQKTLISTTLKQQFAKMKARREQMKAHWEQHRAATPASAAQ